MSIKGPDAFKTPLAGGAADLQVTVSSDLAERAKSLAQLRQVSNEAAKQFADAMLPKIQAEQTDGLFGAAFSVPPFGWIDRMPGRHKQGDLPGDTVQEQLATGFKQLYAQASHQLHRALEALEGRTNTKDVILINEQELVPIQRALARIDVVLGLQEKLTMLGQRAEINKALKQLEQLATDVRAAVSPMVKAIEVRDRVLLDEKMEHLGQGDAHQQVDLQALSRAGISPAAFERYQPGDVLIIAREAGGKPIFGSVLDKLDTKDGPVARVLTVVGDQIEMRYVAKDKVEELNQLKLNDNYSIDGVRYWVAPDRKNGVRVASFDPEQPGKAPVDIDPNALLLKLGAAENVASEVGATQLGVERKPSHPEVIQVVRGHQTPRIMVTSNELFDGAAWSKGHEQTNDDALRMGKVGDQYAALIADQVGFSKENAQVSSAFIDGIWQQLENKQAGTAEELMERGVRSGARGLAADNKAATSLTAGIFSRTKDGVQLDIGQVGNTQVLVIRDGSVLFKSEPHVMRNDVTSHVGAANNPTRTLDNDNGHGQKALDHDSVQLKKGDVVLFVTNGVRNMNLRDQAHHADAMAQPHSEFTPFHLAGEVRGKRSAEEMVAAIRDLAVDRAKSGSAKPADLSVMALTIKVGE